MNKDATLVDNLARSETFQSYQRAFTDATGLPMNLSPVESWQLPHRGKKNENGFCAIMSERSRSCANCLQVQHKLSENANHQAYTAVCGAGMSETAVPVRLGEKLVGFLHTGQVFRKKPTGAQFDRTAKMASELGVDVDTATLRDAYLGMRVLSPKQYASSVSLLSIFAEHLSMISNQVVVQQQKAEPPVITRAKQFIGEQYQNELSLGQVARAVNTSTFYFCKLFKKATGINFTEYLSRMRIEKAKNLLLNPNLRISEIAYEVGFQSLTHFNRVFKKILGQAPTEYRSHLPTA
jgi:AraC-like DNA-binding protein